jgi:hypothetical protein
MRSAHRRGVGAQHDQPGAVVHDVDVGPLAAAAVVFGDIGGVVECRVHHHRIVLIDLDQQAVDRFVVVPRRLVPFFVVSQA